MSFVTKLDYSDNRQIKQFQLTNTQLSGTTEFGVPYTGLTGGVEETTVVITGTLTGITSTFSGNSSVTNIVFGDSRMISAAPSLYAITNLTSGDTQTARGFDGVGPIIVDGNIVYSAYTGSTYDFTVSSIEEVGVGEWTGETISNTVSILSGGSADFTGRTIWVDVFGITRTEKLILVDKPEPITGITTVLTRGTDGEIYEVEFSAVTTDNFITGGTFNVGTGDLDLTTVSGNTITTNLDGRYLNLSATTGDDYVTGSTYNPSTGIINFERLSGGTFNVDIGITSGDTTNWDATYDDSITGITVTGNVTKTITLEQRDGGTLTANFTDNSGGGSGSGDVVTGMTFDIGTGILELRTLSGDTIQESLDDRYSLTGHTHTTSDITDFPADLSAFTNSVGYITGFTNDNIFVTGSTFNTSDGVLEFTNTSGGTFNVDLDDRYSLTGHTHDFSGLTNTGHTHTVSEITDFTDTNDNIFVSGGTFNTGNGEITYTNTSGGTFNIDIDGRYLEESVFTTYTGTTIGTDDYLTGHTFNTTTGLFESTLQSGSTVSVNLDGRYSLTGHTHTISDITDYAPTDDYVTGHTFNTSTGLFESTLQSGSTVSVNLDGRYSLTGHTHTTSDITDFPTDLSAFTNSVGYITGFTNDNIFVSGGTFSSELLEFTNTSGGTFNVDLSNTYSLTGHTHTISEITDYVPTDDYLTGHTFNTSTGLFESTLQSGGTVSVNLDGRYLTGFTDTLANVALIYNNPTYPTSIQPVSGSSTSSGDYSTIGGGSNNTASQLGTTVGGGQDNLNTGNYSTISGGWKNDVLSQISVIGGGVDNTISTDRHYSTIAGGQNNIISGGTHGTIGGGQNNTASGKHSFVGGGLSNTASGNYYSTVSGGYNNTASGGYSTTVGGGRDNTASGYYSATVGGGQDNTASGSYSTIAGGQDNTASGYTSTIGGGLSNTASAYYSFIGAGRDNSNSGYGSSISGGLRNTILSGGDFSSIGAGVDNISDGFAGFIGAGVKNSISNSADWSVIAGGTGNTLNATTSFIGGGSGNTVSHTNTFVLGSDITTTFIDTTYVEKLLLVDLPPTDEALTKVLGRDTDGRIYEVSTSGFTGGDYLTGHTFNTSTGLFESTLQSGSTVSVNLDGRYSLTGHTHIVSDITDFPTDLSAFTNSVGYITGFTNDNIFVSGGTFSSELLEFTNTSGGTFNVDLSNTYSLTGHTHTISEITDYVPTDDYVSSGSFNTTNGEVTLTRLSGGTVVYDLDGRYSLTGHTHDLSDLTNTGHTHTISEIIDYVPTDDYVTGHTFNTGTGLFESTLQSGGTVSVNLDGRYSLTGHTHTTSDITDFPADLSAFTNSVGYITGFTNDNIFVSGGTFSSELLEFTNTSGGTFNVDLSNTYSLTGHTHTISEITDYVPTDDYLTGHTFNTSTGLFESTLQSGSTVSVNLDGRYALIGGGSGDDWVSGATFNTGNGILTLTRVSGGTVTVDLDDRYSLTGHTHVVSDITDLVLPYTYAATQRITPTTGTFTNTSNYSTIGGGDGNIISGSTYISIGGGRNNTASGGFSAIGGGDGNNANGRLSFIGGGSGNNTLSGYYSYSVIGGGQDNTASAYRSTIGGGWNNTISSGYSTIAGGQNNIISGGTYGTIGGGINNTASDGVSTISGGQNNKALGSSGFIGGGEGNNITASRTYSTIAGGQNNVISGGTHGGILGGRNNSVGHSDSFIIGSNLTTLSTNTTYTENLNVTGTLQVDIISAATTDTDRFLVSDGGTVKYRTGAQVLSDIGAQASGNYLLDTTDNFTGTLTITNTSATPVNALVLDNTDATIGNGNIIQFDNSDFARITETNNASGEAQLGFKVRQTSSVYEVMTIQANGQRVGINNTSPTYTLDVTGNARITSIGALGSTATTFLTHTAGLIQSRTAAQVLSDIGAQASGDFLSANAEDNKTAGSLIFNDNIQLRLGVGNDMRMYHTGTQNNFDLYNGDLLIRDTTSTRFTFGRTTGAFTSTGVIHADTGDIIPLKATNGDGSVQFGSLASYTGSPNYLQSRNAADSGYINFGIKTAAGTPAFVFRTTGIFTATSTISSSAPINTYAFQTVVGSNSSGLWNNNNGGTDLFLRDTAGTIRNLLSNSGDSYIDGGNLGVGTTDPITDLTLGTSTTGISFQSLSATFNSGKIAVINVVEAGSGNGDLIFETYEGGSGGGERMRIEASGDVGIGITSPEALTHIYASEAEAQLKIEGGLATSLAIGEINSSLLFGSNDNSVNGSGEGANNIGGKIASITENTNGALVGLGFYTFNQTTIDTGDRLHEHMRLTYDGNLGIGTTTPDNELHVSGTGRFTTSVIVDAGATNTTQTINDVVGYEVSGENTGGGWARGIVNTLSGTRKAGIGFLGVAGGALTHINLAVDADWWNASAGLNIKATALAWKTDEFYIDSAGDVGINTSNPINTLHVNGITSISDASNPLLYFRDGSNVLEGGVGFSSTTDGLLRFAVGGSGLSTDTKMVVKSDGRIGIGETNPDSKLHIYETTNLGGTVGNSLLLHTIQNTGGSTGNQVYIKEYALRNATGTDWTSWNSHNSIDVDGVFDTPGTNTKTFWERDPQSGKHYFGDSAIYTLTVDSLNDRVGIGTTSPSTLLDVSGSVGNIQVDASGARLMFTRTSTNYIQANNVGGQLYFKVNGEIDADASMIINTSGDVGIGTISPDTKLEVADTYPIIRLTDTRQLGEGSYDGVYTAGIEFYTEDASGIGAHIGASIRSFSDTGASTTPAHNLTFSTSLSSAVESEAMRITSNGNVSIGNTNDTYKLDVSGTGRFTGDVIVPAEAYGTSWSGSSEVPTKDDIYDELEAIKVYTALVTQSGTAAPAVSTIKNGIGSIVWTRVSAGNYSGTLTGAFTLNKVAVFVTPGNNASGGTASIYRLSANVLKLLSFNSSSTAADAIFNGGSMRIEVHP